MDQYPPPVQRDWMGLRWTAWMPLMAAHPLALAQLPSIPGVYRVRRTDRRQGLLWIGWAPVGVREVVERLSRQVHLPVEPYDEPPGPATLLWSLRRTHGAGFEVSGAAVEWSDTEAPAQVQRLRAAAGERGPSRAQEPESGIT